MNITKRNKYGGRGFDVVKTQKTIPIVYDIKVLDLMCTYVISENSYIRKSGLLNMRNLVHLLDMERYNNDPEKIQRINFIKKALEGRLNMGLKNTVAIINYANGGIINEDQFVPPNNLLSTEELEWLDGNISDSLKYVFLYNDADRLSALLDRFRNGDYRDRSVIVGQIEELISSIQSSFRRVKVESREAKMFSLRSDRFDSTISDIYDRAINPNRKLFTGMQGFNMLTNGGFESGRVYGLFGATGVGKSLTLLNIAYQIKKYNRFYKSKDPTKIPVIVILTMENDVDETVKRLYCIATGANNDEFKSVPLDEIKRRLVEDGELYLSDDNPIDIVIKYVPSGGVDTSYMYTLCEELEDDGYEVVAFIQDHLKKIRSANYKNVDLRIELGEIINEFKAFAIIKDIPVITCSHLNRDGCAKLEQASQSSKADLVRMLGKANIGESLLILDNIDFAFLINKEYDEQGNPMLTVLTTKHRDYVPIEYIAQPFETGIKLAEDFYLDTPLFKETTGRKTELNRGQITMSQYTNIGMLYDDEDEDDIFGNATCYGMDTPLPLVPQELVNPQPEMIECVRFVANPARRADIA